MDHQTINTQNAAPASWSRLLSGEPGLLFAIIASAVLLHAMNTLLMSTILPSAVRDIGGTAYMGWATSIFMIASITAATAAGRLKLDIGGRNAFALGTAFFLAGSLACALAPSMSFLIAGRFFQGLGGGLMAALGYALIGNIFDEALWPRIFAALSGVWGVAALAGPFIGGVTTSLGSWRLAFILVTFMAALMIAVILWKFPPLKSTSDESGETQVKARYPLLRLTLIASAILSVSVASTRDDMTSITLLIATGIGAFVLMKRLDQNSPNPLLPTDGFTLTSIVGLGLWVVLLISMANDPFALFGPLFLQTLHGLSPLAAGYLVAIEAMSWTVTAIIVASLSPRFQPGLMIAGPLVMGVGLLGAARFLPDGPVYMIVPVAILLGAGIGGCWAFFSQRIMSFAKPGEEDIAASSIATTQMIGIAFGAVLAGLAANQAGLDNGISIDATKNAAFWVPAIFIPIALTAALAALRLTQIEQTKKPGSRTRA